VSEKKIQQLVIDRSQPKASEKSSVILVTILALIIASVGLFWLNSPTNTAPLPLSKHDAEVIAAQIEQSVIAPVTFTEKPQINSNAVVLDASGHVVARRVATVSSRVTGKLEQLHIEEGFKVNKADIIAELDDKQANISYQLALADLSAQQARFEEMLVLQKFAQQKSHRQSQLAKSQLISVQLSEDSELKTAQIIAQLKNRKALVELAKQRTELALYHLEQHKIRAPFDGVVISKNAQVGELISAGSSGGGFIRTGVGTIVDMNSLEVEVEVGESYINRVHAEQEVIATLDAYPQWQINSQVIAVIPTADRQKASIKVRIKLFDIDHRVLPDMGVKVSFLSSPITAKL